jgi:hypothetical protein
VRCVPRQAGLIRSPARRVHGASSTELGGGDARHHADDCIRTTVIVATILFLLILFQRFPDPAGAVRRPRRRGRDAGLRPDRDPRVPSLSEDRSRSVASCVASTSTGQPTLLLRCRGLDKPEDHSAEHQSHDSADRRDQLPHARRHACGAGFDERLDDDRRQPEEQDDNRERQEDGEHTARPAPGRRRHRGCAAAAAPRRSATSAPSERESP